MSPSSGVRRIVPLTYGWEHLPKSVSVAGADPAIRLREPVPGVLCEVDGGWVLLDAGFNHATLSDPLLRRRFVPEPSVYDIEMVGGSEDCIAVAFEAVGVDPADVVVVGVSHLHIDHAGGLRWFTERAAVHCQRRELEFGLTDAAEASAMLRIDYDDRTIDWRLADGDVEVAPGITAIATYGHTPGHQSFLVGLAPTPERPDGGGFVFAFDAADLQENLDDERSPGHVVDDDHEAAIESIRRLKAIATEKGYRVIPGHDPDVWPSFTDELLGVPVP